MLTCKRRACLVTVSSIAWLVSCGGGGDGDTTPTTPDENNPPVVNDVPITTPISSTDIISQRGRPTLFSLECSRHVYDAASENWLPQDDYVRLETWIYSNGSGSNVFSIVNGEVIGQTQTSTTYSNYPNPNIDPRTFGCREPIETVERVLDATRFSTSSGTPAEPELNLGSGQLEYTYYTVNGSTTGIRTVYINNTLIGMVTL